MDWKLKELKTCDMLDLINLAIIQVYLMQFTLLLILLWHMNSFHRSWWMCGLFLLYNCILNIYVQTEREGNF